MTSTKIEMGLLTLLVAGACAVPAFSQSTTATTRGVLVGPVSALPSDPGSPFGAGSVSNQWVQGDATMICSYVDLGTHMTLTANVQGASSTGFFTFLSLGFGTRFSPGTSSLIGWAPTDSSGAGSFLYDIPLVQLLPVNFEIEIRGMYVDQFGHFVVTNPVPFLINPRPAETLDFDWLPGGLSNPAGMLVAEQWADMGMHVSATNNTPGHPDQAVLFDSGNPSGNDYDLATPGYGPMNDRPFGMLLIVPENINDFDGDGLVDDPNDESGGGTIVFGFDDPIQLTDMTLIDIDLNETAQVRGFKDELLVMDLPLAGTGDNSAFDLGFPAELIDRLEVEFSGSGAIADVGLIPCPVTANFDVSSTGVPMGMRAGEVVKKQYLGTLGFTTSALSFRAGGTNKAILFDSANPTGGDYDLATPGYHPTNTVPHKMILILARDDTDLDFDGLVDIPNDDELGGVLTFDFETDVAFHSATVLDVDNSDVSYFEAYDSKGVLIGTVPLANLGDNSIQTVYPEYLAVRRIELHLGGSGALVDLNFCRDEGLSM